VVVPTKYKDPHGWADCVDGFIRVVKQTDMMHIVPVGAIVEPAHLVRGNAASVTREESTPRFTQLEVSLQSIPLSCLAIGLDIGLIQGLIDGPHQSFTQAQKVIRVE
jgi:hypothetical protein